VPRRVARNGERHLAWIKNALDQEIWEQAQPSAH